MLLFVFPAEHFKKGKNAEGRDRRFGIADGLFIFFSDIIGQNQRRRELPIESYSENTISRMLLALPRELVSSFSTAALLVRMTFSFRSDPGILAGRSAFPGKPYHTDRNRCHRIKSPAKAVPSTSHPWRAAFCPEQPLQTCRECCMFAMQINQNSSRYSGSSRRRSSEI